MSRLVRSQYLIPLDEDWGYPTIDPYEFKHVLPDFAVWLIDVFCKSETRPTAETAIKLTTTPGAIYLNIAVDVALYEEFQANPVYFERP